MSIVLVFFFNDTATTEIYTLSLHDALPILETLARIMPQDVLVGAGTVLDPTQVDGIKDVGGRLIVMPHADLEVIRRDRKSTRLNSSHANISYAVFCLKINNNFYRLCVHIER